MGATEVTWTRQPRKVPEEVPEGTSKGRGDISKESLMCPHKKAGYDRRCMDDSQDAQAQARLDLLSVPYPLILKFWRSLRGAAQRQRGGGRTEKYQRTLMPTLLASEIPELGSGKKL